MCTCTWTRDAQTGRPYICVGGLDTKIKVYDVVDGRLVTVSVSRRETSLFVMPRC
jgi:hypothetical protein